MRKPISTTSPPSPFPALPGWAIPRRPATTDAEAAFLAGAALNSLDNLVRAEPAWAGCWRQRLALKCAATAVALAGRTESEAALRDAWYLRQATDAPGPAGNVLSAWRRLATRSPALDAAALRSVSNLFAIQWSDELARLPERVDMLVRSTAPAPVAAAAALTELQAVRPDAALLGWWLADQVLARSLRWPLSLPLLVAQAQGAGFRAGGRGRVRPGGEGFERAMCAATALAAAEACRLAADIAEGAARLQAVAPKLRAKGAAEVVRRLLEDDAVPGTLQTEDLSRWGARRLFERLTTLDAVRELSGRGSFRIYGL
jgi:hypothetical protein